MNTMDTRYAVVYAFNSKRAQRAGNFYSTGDALYSYDVKLAYREKDGTVCYTPAMERKFSTTSSAHQTAVRAVLGNKPVREGA